MENSNVPGRRIIYYPQKRMIRIICEKMKSKFHLSGTEREVFEMLWKYKDGIKQSQLLKVFIEYGKDWKRQTLNTHLSVLEEKGLIKRENRIVWPLYTEREFNNLQMKEAIEKMYAGKLSNFIAAFTKENSINEEEAEQLIRILERHKRENTKR